MIQTSRGYEDPFVRQLALFLQNKVGELGDVLRHLEKQTIGVHALCVTDSVDFAVVRLVVDHVDRALRVLEEVRIPVSQNSVLAVELKQGDSVLSICRALLAAEINTHYVYPMLSRPRGNAALILHVDDPDTGAEILAGRGFYLIDESELSDLEALD